MEPSLAPWRSGTKVGMGGARPGRQTVCVRCTMPALQSVSSVLSAKQTLHFPLGLVALPSSAARQRSEEPGQTKRAFYPI